VAIEHNLYKNIGDNDVCTESELFEVKVHIIFLATMGFSARRERR
jgi:hypothetical protein